MIPLQYISFNKYQQAVDHRPIGSQRLTISSAFTGLYDLFVLPLNIKCSARSTEDLYNHPVLAFPSRICNVGTKDTRTVCLLRPTHAESKLHFGAGILLKISVCFQSVVFIQSRILSKSFPLLNLAVTRLEYRILTCAHSLSVNPII